MIQGEFPVHIYSLLQIFANICTFFTIFIHKYVFPDTCPKKMGIILNLISIDKILIKCYSSHSSVSFSFNRRIIVLAVYYSLYLAMLHLFASRCFALCMVRVIEEGTDRSERCRKEVSEERKRITKCCSLHAVHICSGDTMNSIVWDVLCHQKYSTTEHSE